MKKIIKVFLLFSAVLAIALLLPFSVSASPVEDGRTILGETYTLESGRILDGDLLVIAGVVDIEDGAEVNGNVIVLGGLVTIDGTVQGDLTAVGGTVNLEENAIIQGNVISPASFINQDADSMIVGDQIEGWIIPWTNLNIPRALQPRLMRTVGMPIIPIITRIGRETAFALVMVALSALLLLIMPKSSDVMTRALVSEPWHILGYGALTVLVMLVGGVMLSITICLIPVVVLVGLAFGLAVMVGWLVLGYELGKQIAKSIFKTTWHPVLAAALGNFVLYLTAKGLELIPCLGGFIVFIAMVFGLGMTVVTLFGTRSYPRKESKEKIEQIVLKDIEQTDVIGLPENNLTDNNVVLSNRPIESLAVDARIIKLLRESGVTTIDEILEKIKAGDQALLSISGFGKKSLGDLKEALRQMGYEI